MLLDSQLGTENGTSSAGDLMGWIVDCDGGERCASPYLASWGFQCSSWDSASCCMQASGKFCMPLAPWADEPVPASWTGADLTEGGDKVEGQGTGGARGWRRATATYFTSYPACCHNSDVDQTECTEYSGCRWAGQFAGLGTKSESWVRANNIVAFYTAPESRNRKVPGHLLRRDCTPGRTPACPPLAQTRCMPMLLQEWAKKWNGRKLRLRNPANGRALNVLVADTCADSDCSGCCSRNAWRGGGTLIDLEFNTARRFWGSNEPPGLMTIEWQLA